MPPQRKTSTRQYAIGAGVMARDGIAGTLERIVVDPDDAQVVDLIVSVPRVGPDREVVVPATRVVHADADGIVVDLTTAEVRALPEFEAVRFRQPEAGWEGLPEHTPDVVLFWAPRRAVEAFVPPSVVPEPNVEGVRNIPRTRSPWRLKWRLRAATRWSGSSTEFCWTRRVIMQRTWWCAAVSWVQKNESCRSRKWTG